MCIAWSVSVVVLVTMVAASTGCISQQVYNAAARNDVEALKKFHAEGHDLRKTQAFADKDLENQVNCNGLAMPIVIAIAKGNREAARYLYSVGATNDVGDRIGGNKISYSALGQAVRCGQFDIASDLIDLGERVPKGSGLLFDYRTSCFIPTNDVLQMFPHSTCITTDTKGERGFWFKGEDGGQIGNVLYASGSAFISLGSSLYFVREVGEGLEINPGTYRLWLYCSFFKGNNHVSSKSVVEVNVKFDPGKVYVIYADEQAEKVKKWSPRIREFDCRTRKGKTSVLLGKTLGVSD